MSEPTPQEWIETLQSGKYRQAKGTLYGSAHAQPDEDVWAPALMGYCCLGVLAEMCGVAYDDIRLAPRD